MNDVPDATSLRRAPVQRRSAERLTRILDACADLLDEVGYDTLSTRAVAPRGRRPPRRPVAATRPPAPPPPPAPSPAAPPPPSLLPPFSPKKGGSWSTPSP